MSNVITIRVDDDVKQMLNTFAEKSNTRKREIVNKALRHYIYLQEIKNVRKELKPYAEAWGFYKEEDILNTTRTSRNQNRVTPGFLGDSY